MDQTKACTACKVEKTLDAFYPAKRYRLGVTSICRECDKKQGSQRYLKNRELIKERHAKWRESNREHIRKKSSEWYAANKDHRLAKAAKWSLKNEERHRDLKKRWRVSNRSRANALTAEYRATKSSATPPWLSAIDRAQIQEIYDIALARTVQTGVEHHVDHIHPLQGDGFNGLHVPWNLRVITAYENRSKLNKLPDNESHLLWSHEQ